MWGGGEYLRASYDGIQVKGADVSKYNNKINGLGIEYIDDISRDGTNMNFYIETGDDGADVEVPIANYKGYHVYDEDENEYEIYDSENFNIMFKLPSNYDGDIFIEYTDPWYWTLAFIVPFSCVIILFLWGVYKIILLGMIKR